MKQWAARVASAVMVAFLAFTTGCPGFFVYPGSLPGGSTTSTGNYVYVANQTAGTVAGYSIGTNSLTAVSGSPFNTGITPVAMAVNPTNTLLFVSGTSGTSGVIDTYSIASSGVISLLKTYTLGTTVENALAVSPDGNWLVGLEANGTTSGVATVDTFAIAVSSGTLTAATPATYSFPSGTVVDSRAVTFSPNGLLVFAALGTAGDVVFPFTTSNGTFGTGAALTTGSSVNADDGLTANGSYLFVARTNGSNNGVVATYTVTATTVSPAVGPPTVAAGEQPYSVVVNGSNVYAANQAGGNITGYSGATTGTLTALSLSPYSVSAPTALAIDETGTYLLEISNTATGNNLNMYSFDSAGNLVSSTSANAGMGPIAMVTTKAQ